MNLSTTTFTNVLHLLQACLQGLINGETVTEEHQRTIQHHLPVLFDHLYTNQQLSTSLINIVTALLKTSLNPFSIAQHQLPQSTNPDDPTKFYPNLPQLVERGKYVKDQEKKRTEDKTVCHKNKKSGSTLFPGQFSTFCPCGIYVFVCN